MKTQNIELMTAEIDAHRAADLLVQGRYYDLSTGRADRCRRKRRQRRNARGPFGNPH